MGVSRTPDELARKLARLAGDYADLPKALVSEGALIAKQSVVAVAPSRLRGVGKRGARLNVRYTVSTSGDEPKALVFAVGPWGLIENDTRPHRIPRQRGARARKRVVVIPGASRGGVRAWAQHPGTHGKHPWAKGVAVAIPRVDRLFQVRGDLVMRRIF